MSDLSINTQVCLTMSPLLSPFLLSRSSMQAPFEQRYELFTTTAASSTTSVATTRSNQSGTATARRLILPVIRQDQDHSLRLVDAAKEEDLREYLKDDLNVDSLNKIHKHLWLAGLPQCARPLHHQLLIDRKIMVTERADLHLLWRNDRLYLKPLPDYLLSYNVWERSLAKDVDICENAKGFLLSYLWLIRQKSDYIIAQREHLVSSELTWEHWTEFSRAVFPNLTSISHKGISPRYLYGELRLGRVNLAYRLCRKTRSFKTLVRGHYYVYHTYAAFIEQNFAWVLTVIVYITIVLTAMQVGLATSELQNNHLFNRASYGFTVFSILAPLGLLFVLLSVLLILVIYNFNHAVEKRSDTQRRFPDVFGSVALQNYKH